MSRNIEQEEEKVPVWWSEEEESAKPLPVSSTQVARQGQQKVISLGRGQRINRAGKESGTSSSSTTAVGATKRKLREKGFGPEKEPDQWEDSPAFEEPPLKSPEGPPPKKPQWVPADGSTVKPEDIDWEIEEDPGPPPLEDITEEGEEDSLTRDAEEMDEAIDAAGDEYRERMLWLAEMAKMSPHLQELMGIDDPQTIRLAFAAGARKVQELEHVNGERMKRDILSYTKLVKRFQVDRDTLQECCVAGKLRAKKTRKRRRKGDTRIVELKKTGKDEPGAGPSSSQATAEAM